MKTKAVVEGAIRGEAESRLWIAYLAIMEYEFEKGQAGAEGRFGCVEYLRNLSAYGACRSIAQESGIDLERHDMSSQAWRTAGGQFAWRHRNQPGHAILVRAILDGHGLYDVRVQLAEMVVPA